MWAKTDDADFGALLKQFETNPTQAPSDDNVLLLQRLIYHYIATGDVVFYRKITDFLNIFVTARFSKNSLEKMAAEIWTDMPHLYGRENRATVFEPFPVMERVLKYIDDLYHHTQTEAKTAYDRLDLPDSLGVDPHYILSHHNKHRREYAKGLVNPSFKIHIQAHPEPQTNHIEHLSYAQLLNVLCENLEKQGIDLTQKKADLIQAVHRKQLAYTLWNVIDLFNNLRLNNFEQIVHTCYAIHEGTPILYDHISLDAILPHPLFKRILKYYFKIASEKNPIHMPAYHRHTALLLGKLLTEENRRFQGWLVSGKDSGKEPGFILISPNRRHKVYGKFTHNVYREYFCSKLLSALGIKMAESTLIVDEYGNPYLLTEDLTRSYLGRNGRKNKRFTLFPNDETFKEKQEKETNEEAERHKVLRDFIAVFDQSQKTRVSFAKLLIVGVAFGLSDLGGHLGNVGPIHTECEDAHQKKSYDKFGIVDFSVDLRDITSESLIDDEGNEILLPRPSIMGRIDSMVSRMCPIFKALFEHLEPLDFQIAARELWLPKRRQYSAEGFLLVQYPRTQTSAADIFLKVRTTVLKEIAEFEGLAVTERRKIVHDINQIEPLFLNNLQYVVTELFRWSDVMSRHMNLARPS